MNGLLVEADASERKNERSAWVLAGIAIAVPMVVAWLLPAVAQPASYHLFADQRTCLGIPNALNVLSNVAFLVVGALGLRFTLGGWRRRNRDAFSSAATAVPYSIAFGGVALTTFGSAYYHWNPNDATLVWDRLPMAFGFAGIVAGTLGDRVREPEASLAVVLSIAALGSVLWWAFSGNLLPYLAMQGVYLVVALYATARMRSRFSHAGWLYVALAVYGAAFLCEQFDLVVFDALGGIVSGHTIKHLLAASAMAVVYAMLLKRRSLALT